MTCQLSYEALQGLMVLFAGVMARSMDDIIMYDELFSDCPRPGTASIQKLTGLRLGFPHQLWQDLDDDVSPLLTPTLAGFASPVISIMLEQGFEKILKGHIVPMQSHGSTWL